MSNNDTIRKFELEKETELRIEVGPTSSLNVRTTAGFAEIFGAEIPPDTWISVPPLQNIAIFTWNGATIEVDGESEVEYVADETPMMSYVNVHAIVDGRRIRAMKASTSGDVESMQGPRVIVVGPTDSGKSSLCTMLLNWACKRSWKPTFIDLDIGQGSTTIPGCVVATSVQLPIDSSKRTLESPIVYFYGHSNPSANIDLYKVLLKELAETVEQRFSENAESQLAGMVINTMGWVDGVGYELLLHSIDTFNANVVLVLGQEKLYSMLKGKRNVDVVKLHKSGGVVLRNAKNRQNARDHRIKEYFYGLGKGLLPVYTHIVNFNDISIFRIGGGPQAPRSALPIGAEPTADPTRLVTVNITNDLLHSILAVSYAKEQNKILTSNVAGFVHVTNIDMQSNTITYIAPCPGELPGKLFITGTLKWSNN